MVAYAVPRVWVSVGGNRKMGTKYCLRINENVDVTASLNFQFLLVPLFVLSVMVAITAIDDAVMIQ